MIIIHVQFRIDYKATCAHDGHTNSTCYQAQNHGSLFQQKRKITFQRDETNERAAKKKEL